MTHTPPPEGTGAHESAPQAPNAAREAETRHSPAQGRQAPAGTMPTTQLLDALHAHYIRSEDRQAPTGAGAVFLTEVTAPGSTRRADAVHVGLWQSRGAGEIDVCELKTSRSDWRRELDKPEKAEAWWPYSTRFWIVAPHTSIVPVEELPDGWGLMVPGTRGRRFKTIVKPAIREPRVTVPLLLTLLKCTETTRTNALREQHRRLASAQYEREQQLRRELADATDPDSKRRLDALSELEKALGIEIGSRGWRNHIDPHLAGTAMGEYVRNEQAHAEATRHLDFEARSLERLSEQLAKTAQELRAIHPEAEGSAA